MVYNSLILLLNRLNRMNRLAGKLFIFLEVVCDTKNSSLEKSESSASSFKIQNFNAHLNFQRYFQYCIFDMNNKNSNSSDMD